ncbi:acetamidase/formamidase family protein [Frankia sp. AgB1.9]|uniref:acetamidase/formamidase family protein n=1 Tax=unclassified Frankia TaxID=2632575 RepID=UPI001931CD5D|nr:MULTISPECIES: acetamidase/formamidase family protein [unclassified Frankia]MBL7488903.1 acetamidase/formamidase family protein [Frankia sp. AgW1.1]MBL7547640.1 acetamidase/formamidase family protein [Frankia sp. AgB1.9]MBL7623427.1 acetamidase/formamidase family protein [Frankia sp. AgB1.8]
MALQPGKGKVDGKHYLPSTPETVRWGELPTARTRPVLTVDSGSTVTIDTVSQEGILEDQGRDPDAFFGRHGVTSSEVLDDARAIASSGIPHRFGVDGPHVVTGPVHVRGAEPGDVLRVEILSLLPRARYGMISNRHGQGLLAGEFPEGPTPDQDADARHWQGFRTVGNFCAVERRRGKLFGVLDAVAGGARVRFPLNPFIGIMAVAVDLGGEPGGDVGADQEAGTATVPSTSVGLHGGALDCRDLGMGARLYLPVQVPGALFAVGDPHYAAGDGKIGLTALEGPLRATVRLSSLREPAARAALGSLREPFVETEASWLTLGLDVDATEAIRRAARSAVLFLSSRLSLDRASALAYLSAAADFGISQLVNGVQTAYCRIRRSDFTEPPPPRPRLPRAALGRLVGTGEDVAGYDGAGYDLLDGLGPDGAGIEGDADDEMPDRAARTQEDGDAPREDDRVGLPRAAVRRKKSNGPAPLATGADERAEPAEPEPHPAGPDGGPAAPAPRVADEVPGPLPRQVTSGASRRPLRRTETPTPPATG